MNLDCGIYLVTLNNNEPISVNADRPDRAHKCIKVTSKNCKIGRAKSFSTRKKEYFRTFGKHNVNFYPVVATESYQSAEKLILAQLYSYRVIGSNGRRNEWLENIDPIDALSLVIGVFESSELEYRVLVRPRKNRGIQSQKQRPLDHSAGAPKLSEKSPEKFERTRKLAKSQFKKIFKKLLRMAWREIQRL